jgi:hypothetical protein
LRMLFSNNPPPPPPLAMILSPPHHLIYKFLLTFSLPIFAVSWNWILNTNPDLLDL